MADDLYPTKTRLTLLREVKQGHVYRTGTDPKSYLASNWLHWQTVTARIAELCQAGWTEPGPQNQHDRRRPYQITSLGEAVLAAEDEGNPGARP